MADIETLTADERAFYGHGGRLGAKAQYVIAKALRIIDALTEALAAADEGIAKRERVIQTLNARVRELEAHTLKADALIDAMEKGGRDQAARIERARWLASQSQPVDSPEARLASDLREVLGVE